MKNFRASRILLLAVAAFLWTACGKKDEPVRTRDDIAADSALAADLALANRDTLLIDSIGQYNPPRGIGSDTSLGAIDTIAPLEAPPAAPPEAPPAAPTARPSPSRPVAKSSPARRTTGDPCNSPGSANQTRCVQSRLAEADRRLNGVYRALIIEMRRQQGVRPGQKDPPSVQRLRAGQRSWLVYRDTECRRRGRGTEGPLWARTRVACLGEFSVRRANELADNFSRLTAR
ncbi:MAG: lysozyme inhibitor LprI family protein [Gemmatimonadaceae bacterium]